MPLPAGAPAGFPPDNVGDYRFERIVEIGRNRVGDPIRVTMRAEGRGLVSLLTLPEVTVSGQASRHPPRESADQAT